MSAVYPEWAGSELAELAARYGEPIGSVTRDPDASAYVASINTQRRPAEVCMVVRRRSGGLLLATKRGYPVGVYRLLTGGIHQGESVYAALLREVAEETGLTVKTRRFLVVARYQGPDAPDLHAFATFAFLVDEVSGELQVNDPSEGLTDFREVTPTDLLGVAAQLDALSPSPRANARFSRRAWGRYRAAIHRLVWQALSDG